MDDLQRRLDEVDPEMERVVVIFDGIFSMRGDAAPVREILGFGWKGPSRTPGVRDMAGAVREMRP
jgi:hypothetical protein